MKHLAWFVLLTLPVLLFTAGAARAQEAAEPEVAIPADAMPPAPDLQLRDTLAEMGYDGRSTVEEQTDVAVTVYNNNLALVRDRRKVKLMPGEVSLQFMDVAGSIQPETVSLVSLTDPAALRILEQNYEYDLMSPEKLMEKYVGRDVRLVNKDNELAFAEITAKLLSVNNGPIYQIGSDIYLGHPGNVVLPEIPPNLIAKPTLAWLLDNQGTDHDIEVTYLTGGLTWKADYVLTLGADATNMDLVGWVTLNNQSGAAYNNAELKLVAGEVNRAPVQKEQPEVFFAYTDAAPAPAAPPMREESFAEYHLYTLDRRTTLKENQSKQVRLLAANGVAITKKYEFRGEPHFYLGEMGEFPKQNAAVFLVFKNEETNQLGVPLPAGIMRVYQADQSGMLQFAGEDFLEHTPKDEEVRLRLGEAFDVIGERIQTDFQRYTDRITACAYRITLRNHKETEVPVDIIETFSGDWEMVEQSHPFVKRDAQTAVFSVAVPADGDVEVKYRVRVRQ